jgi:hypothetical protein
MKRLLLFLLLTALAASAQESLDGPNHVFHDDLLDHLQGSWKVTGPIRGHPAEVHLTAEWVLNHQFLHIHQKGISSPYEAEIYIGYDNASERYVAHWTDIYGGRFSETLGYGTRSGDSIRFVFEYPDGPFHNTFTWDPKTKSWHFFLEMKDSAGKWKTFADQTAVKVE